MTTLRSIKTRIHAIGNIQQITKAMEKVAAVHLRRTQHVIEQFRPYVLKMQEILTYLTLNADGFTHPFFKEREVKNIGLVVIAADKGLCGSYNSNIFSKAEEYLRTWNAQKVTLIPVGHKAVEYFRRSKHTVKHEVTEWAGKMTVEQINALIHQIVEPFESGQWDEVWVLSMHYISILSRPIVCEKFLPLQRVAIDRKQFSTDYIYEPKPEALLQEFIPRYCLTRLKAILDEAHASELAARVISMKSATKNAEEMVEKLTLIRNKLRQADVTTEMLEITAGAEGLK
jgi:F-type H+-transporting ATPase subunit gamma